MAKAMNIGVGGVSRVAKKGYVGVNGVARAFASAGFDPTMLGDVTKKHSSNGFYTINDIDHSKAYLIWVYGRDGGVIAIVKGRSILKTITMYDSETSSIFWHGELNGYCCQSSRSDINLLYFCLEK